MEEGIARPEAGGRIGMATTTVRSMHQPPIYCPSPRTFVYRLADELPSTYVNLRLSMAKNGQVKRTRDASEYRDPWRMFEPVPQRAEARTSGQFERGSDSVLCEVPA